MNGWVLIEVETVWDEKTKSGIYKDLTFDKHAKVVIKGTVLSVPKKGNEEVIGEYNYKFPPDNSDTSNFIRNSHLPVTVEKGDTVYFHYLTLEDPNNFLGFTKNGHMYKVALNYVFCSVREGKIIMHNGYVLGKPYFGEGWEEVEVDGVIIAGKVSPSGLISETKDKPLDNVCKISVIGKAVQVRGRDKLPLNRERVEAGSIAMLMPNSEFENEIEGEAYWVFQQKDIVATLRGEELRPEGDYVMVSPKYKEHKGKIHVKKEYMGMSDEGEIEDVGELVDEYLMTGAKIKYALKRHRKHVDNQGLEHVFVREGEVYGAYIALV